MNCLFVMHLSLSPCHFLLRMKHFLSGYSHTPLLMFFHQWEINWQFHSAYHKIRIFSVTIVLRQQPSATHTGTTRFQQDIEAVNKQQQKIGVSQEKRHTTRNVLKSIDFWAITPYSPLSFNRRFGGTSPSSRSKKYYQQETSKQAGANHLLACLRMLYPRSWYSS
jgi:hypothetical protein